MPTEEAPTAAAGKAVSAYPFHVRLFLGILQVLLSLPFFGINLK